MNNKHQRNRKSEAFAIAAVSSRYGELAYYYRTNYSYFYKDYIFWPFPTFY